MAEKLDDKDVKKGHFNEQMGFQKGSKDFDLAVIGGGITGASIARDASLRGLKVILCESHDFGSGASSKSSKLIHGGLRYLEQFDFGLVKEALEERSILLRTDPIHVKWLPFVLPVYKGQRRSLWMIRLGLTVYDLFSPKGAPTYLSLTPAEVTNRFPHLSPKGLKGGCQYFDAQMEDSRIVIENLRSARKNGALLLNYTPAAPLFDPQGQVIGITYNGKSALAKNVIDATGAWSPALQQEIALKPTKGVHLVIPQVHPTCALTLEAPQDQRVIFLLPWEGATLLGTTETPCESALDALTVDESEVRYLLNAYHHYFPKGGSEILGAFAGVRPLVKDAHNQPFKVSRKPILHRSQNGLLTLVGGKYTIYRKMAQDAVDQLTHVRCTTATLPLSESGEVLRPFAEQLALDQDTISHLLSRYGLGALPILQRVEKNRAEGEKFCPFHPFIRAEILYALEEEFVVKAEDWLCRRTTVGFHSIPGCLCRQTVESYLNTHQGNCQIASP